MPRVSDLIAPVYYEAHKALKAGAYSEFWMKGGRGSAKSSWISLEIVMGIVREPEANAIIYRKVAATLRESVYEQIAWAVDMLGLRKWFTFRLSPLEVRYRGGGRILFRGADDPSKSKSIKLAKGYFKYLWFEELAEFDGMQDVRTIKASVLRGGAGNKSFTFYSYNPPRSARDWVNEEAVTPRPDRLVHASSYKDLPPGWLGADFLAEAEALKNSNERAWRHMYMGEVTGTGGAVFDNLALRAITQAEIDAAATFYNGLDFGFAVDPDAYVRWAWLPKPRAIMAISEFYGAHNTTDTLFGRVSALAGKAAVRCDSADPRMIAELRNRGLNAVAVKKGPGSVEHGMRWLQDLGAIIIDPARTPNIAREFRAYEFAQDRHGNFIAEFPDADNHTIDATRYALEPEIGKNKIKAVSSAMLGI